MKQLTIRGFDEELERYLRQLAEVEGLSLNKAALRLLRRGAGLGREMGKNCIGSALDRFFDTWSKTEANEFDESVKDLGRIDEDLWK